VHAVRVIAHRQIVRKGDGWRVTGPVIASGPQVQSLTRWLVGIFASPIGVFVLAVLDSTVFFSVPFGIDAVVIILAARLDGMAWIVPLLAAGGSTVGAALTFWMGIKVGEKGLERYVPAKRLARIRQRVEGGGAVALGALSLIPPPFPFTPFVLAAGALNVRAATFFTTVTASRLLRFGIESWLATLYGRRIVRWLDSALFQNVVMGCIVLTLVLTTVSIVRVIRSSRPAAAAA
jgi:membrane protein YqaA with SNARE-associated domain